MGTRLWGKDRGRISSELNLVRVNLSLISVRGHRSATTLSIGSILSTAS